jgi:hypothetical protein
MNTLISGRPFRNPVSTAERLPNPDPQTMAFAARRIATRYNVGLPLARVVAAIVDETAEVRR